MQRVETNGLTYYRFENLRVPHGVFTRMGGTSEGHLRSLNVGSTVGDDPARVEVNRTRMLAALSLEASMQRTVWQVHSASVIVANGQGPLPDGVLPPRADGLITDRPGLGLVMRFADCVPIIFHDPTRGVIGMAHAGWRGTVANIGPAVVRALQDTYGSRPADLIAGIGPSICAEHYPVGPEVVAAVQDTFGNTADLIWPDAAGHQHLDLWAANERALREAGVEQVDVSGLCTACRTDEFFSHRAERGHTGRFGAVVTLST